MPQPFGTMYQWLTWHDVERCPYGPHDPELGAWLDADYERMRLLALDHYADTIRHLAVLRHRALRGRRLP